MIAKIKHFFNLRERFSQGALILAITTFVSYAVGLLRDRIFAQTFGAGSTLDIYNASFMIPDILLNILIMSALAGGFVPVFSGLLANGKKEEAHKIANTTLNSAPLIMGFVGILAVIFMPALAKIIAPGFDAENLKTFISLSRLMLISPILMSVSNALGYVLIGYKRFLSFGLSPILYNLGIIVGAVTLYPIFGIYGLVLGTIAGALLHLIPRIIEIIKTPFKYALAIHPTDANFFTLLKLTIPKMFGQPVEQLTFSAFNSIATRLAAGSLATVSFARNFSSAGVSLFGIAISLAIFPMLSESSAKKDMKGFSRNFIKALRDILILTIPCAIGLYFLSDIPIRIFLGGGKFTDENILRTASVLSVFALSIPTESLSHLYARSFYALKNTIIPVTASIIGLFIAVSFSYFKAPEIGIIAIPYGFFLGSFTEIALLTLIFMRKIRALRQQSPDVP